MALGREPTPPDWLSDIDLRIGLLFLNPSHRELSSAFAERFRQRLDSALTNWLQITVAYQHSSERERQDLGRMTDALYRSKTFTTAASTTLSMAIYDECDLESDQLREEQRQLAEEWTALKNYPDLHVSPDQLESYPLMEQAAKCNSAERGSLLREARNHLVTYSLGVDSPLPIVRFLHGWALYQISQDPEEAKEILSKLKDTANPPFSCFLSFRLLSQFAQRAGNNPRAGMWTRSALDIKSDPEGLIESALQMAALSDPSKAMELVTKALLIRPGSIVRILADPRCLALGDALIMSALQVLERVRHEGRSASVKWAETAQEVGSVQEKHPSMITVPFELLNGHKQNLQKIDVSDLISAGFLCRNAATSRKDLSLAAQGSVTSELMRRSTAVSLARKATDSVADAREHRVEQARLAYDAAKARAANTTAVIDTRNSKTETLSLNAMIGGAALFVLYIFANATLDPNKFPIGFSKPFGFGMIGTALFMVGIGVWLYIDNQLKGSACERKLKADVADASYALDQSSKEADDVYREQINANRKLLADAEENLKKAEEASRLLKFDEAAYEKQSSYAA